MNIQAKKLSLIEWLVSLKDETVINKMYNFREKLAHTPDKRITLDELLAELELSERARKAGRVIGIDELEKESENW
ncbi:MAG: hypothetical protein ACLQQ4_03385 [Bacteroidia bacterium]